VPEQERLTHRSALNHAARPDSPCEPSHSSLPNVHFVAKTPSPPILPATQSATLKAGKRSIQLYLDAIDHHHRAPPSSTPAKRPYVGGHFERLGRSKLTKPHGESAKAQINPTLPQSRTLQALGMTVDGLLEEQDNTGDPIPCLIKTTRTLLDVIESRHLKGAQRLSQLPEELSAELEMGGHTIDPEVLRQAFDRWTESKEREETVSRANE